MTEEQLVEQVCIALNDFLEDTKGRIRIIIPTAIKEVLTKHQWEFMTRITTLTTALNDDSNRDWVITPDKFGKEIALYRDNYTKPIDYITPTEYVEKLSTGSTPYGVEAMVYTVMGDENDLSKKRFYFLDKPTSDLTVNLLYTVKLSIVQVSTLADEFLATIKANVLKGLTAPKIKMAGVDQYNPAFGITSANYDKAMNDLVAYENGQRGRREKARLAEEEIEAYQYFHK